MNFPVIRLEVQDMKYAIHTALTEHAAMRDASIKAAVNEFCTPGNIDRVIREAAMSALNAAVKEEVRNYFGRWNENGRLAVREAVIAFLDEEFPAKKEEHQQ